MSRCLHPRTRGIYGDEILSTMRRVFWPQRWGGGEIARVRCMVCGRALYGVSLDDATDPVDPETAALSHRLRGHKPTEGES